MKINDRFKQLKKNKKKAFIAYVPFGFPKPKYTKDIILTLASSGVDIIELGIPFSDPLADGPIIQEATTTALKSGANIDKCFKMLKGLKGSLKIPIALMTYYNPVLRYGMDRFLKKLKGLGISGVIVVDLPVDEAGQFIKKARGFDVDTIFFITPTTSFKRAKAIVKKSRGFIYYVSVTGITGPKDLKYEPLISHIKKIKRLTNLPICVGFGVHSRAQVERISSFSDGVIVGSSIVKFIESNFSKKDFLKRLNRHIRSLKG